MKGTYGMLVPTNNCVNMREGSNEYVDWMLPQFQSIKETIVAFTFDKIIQCFVGKVYEFKSIYMSGTPICCGYVDDMVLNPTIDVFQPSLVVGAISRDRTT